MRSSKLLYAGLATSLALAGCGGSNGDPDNGSTSAAAGTGGTGNASKPIDACSLISAEEMTAITTDKVTAVQPTDAGACDYKSEPNDATQIKAVASGGAKQMETVRKSITLLGGMGAAVADKGGAGSDVNAMLKPDDSKAPAIGDEVVWEANDTLAVRKGDAFVEVSPPIMHDPANHPGYPLISKAEKRAIAEKVAVKLLAKLGQH